MADLPAPAWLRGAVPPSGCTVTRRALLGGAAGFAALVLPGCSIDPPSPSTGVPPAGATPGLSPDVEVAASALLEIRAVRAVVTGTRRRHPAARVRLSGWDRLHEAHEASLVDAVPERALPTSSVAPYDVPEERAVALSVLSTREERLHARLDALALRAESGDFARLLASMGAAIGQRMAVTS